MATLANRREDNSEKAGRTCSGVNLAMGKDEGKKRRAGLFFIPPSVHSWSCDHIFETEDGYQHIVDTTSFGAV